MKRRQVLRVSCVAASGIVAGCIGGGGDSGGENDDDDEQIVENYGLPSCDSGEHDIRVTDASLEVGDEAATISVTYEFIERDGEDSGSGSVGVTIQGTFFDAEGNALSDEVSSGFVSTDETIEEELVYSGADWEQTEAFDLTFTPDACA